MTVATVANLASDGLWLLIIFLGLQTRDSWEYVMGTALAQHYSSYRRIVCGVHIIFYT